MTADEAGPNRGAEREAEAFLAGWWSRAEQFRAMLAADDGPISIQLGPDEDVVYIRARREDDGWLVEAVSNNYLPGHTRLTIDDECVLLELGWDPPTGPMPNFFRFWARRFCHAGRRGAAGRCSRRCSSQEHHSQQEIVPARVSQPRSW